MQWPGGRILQRHELDAFLAQAVSNQLYEPDQLQELKVSPTSGHVLFCPFSGTSSRKRGSLVFTFLYRQVEKVDTRGVQLASLFMAGVDTALFINDVCGQPLPWEHCCPWGFFDGKLFQSKLARAARDRSALLDMCEGQVRAHLSVVLIRTPKVNMDDVTERCLSAGGTSVQSREDASGNPRGHQPIPPSSTSSSSSASCLSAPHHGATFLPHASTLPTSSNGWYAPASSPTSSTSPCSAQTQSLPRFV